MSKKLHTCSTSQYQHWLQGVTTRGPHRRGKATTYYILHLQVSEKKLLQDHLPSTNSCINSFHKPKRRFILYNTNRPKNSDTTTDCRKIWSLHCSTALRNQLGVYTALTSWDIHCTLYCFEISNSLRNLPVLLRKICFWKSFPRKIFRLAYM